ncbi:MAG: AAA family ATPase, partial [Lachnospiraceae bacterium]|nr:AAA family ATPase [Lachnospiraceae bacterium]
IAVKVDDTFAAVSLVKEKDYARFDMFEDLPNRCRAMRDFFKLTPAQRANIKTQQAARKYAAYNPDKSQRFTEINEYWLKYLMCKESFLPETQGTIEELLTDARNPKSKAMMKLDYLLNSSPIDKDRKCIRFKELRSALDATIYKMDNVKEHITELLFSNQRSGIRGGNILLVGSAGMGKTTIALKVAQECGLNYDVISLNGMSTPLDWEGLDSSYDNSDVGKLIKCFRKAYTSEMLIVLDELDKMNMSKEGNPMNCLYSSLTGRHEDRFLETMLNTENVIFIATANSTDNIPEAILNRFSVIYMEDYSLEDKVRIAKDYTLPKLYAKFELQEEMICFEEAVLEYIIRNYCEDSGARDLERALEMVLRRVICDWDVDEAEEKVLVDKAYVRMALDGKISSDNPGIRLNRERDQYPEQVAKDIAQILSQKKEKKAGFNEQEKEKAEKRLEYLWVLKKTNKTSVFNPEIFRQQIDSTHYGMNKVKDAVTTFYYLQSLQGCMLNSNLAFVGGMGIGKSSICESIAKAMGLTYCRISLNGMKDENVLKGFPPTYIGADAGIFMKEVKRAKTLRLLVQLDEIDKLQRELSHVLLDLLDRSFTDNFIGYPIDISEVVFIATANDWGNVDPLIRDRFTVIEVDGYTKEEKSEIIENYIIPKLESNFKDAGVSIELSKNGEQLLLDKYCTSFGIRDTQKALQKLVGEKLREQYGQAEAMKVDIQEEDVRRIMGQEPMPRGNFPTEKLAGVSKALAVTGNNYGNAFAIETVLIPGEATVEITGLPKES